MEVTRNPFCKTCEGSGVLITPGGRHAEAAVCGCSQVCTICNGSGFLFEKDQLDRESARKCHCEQRRIRVRMFNEASVPAKYFEARLDERFRDKENQSAYSSLKLLASDYVRGQRGILLMGPSGVGKTFLVAALIHEIIINRGIPAQFRDFFHLLADLRSGYSRGISEAELIGPLVDVEILVVDELGKGRNTPWELNILDVLISQRYNNKKTTVFTTNYTDSRNTTLTERIRGKDQASEDNDREIRDTLRERVGSRIHSRLKEMCDFISILGEDRRERGPIREQG